MTSEAFINPRMLSWARRRGGLSTEQVAEKIKPVPAERIAAWESTDPEKRSRPTFKQAKRLADLLHVPFGYLFLSDEPSEDLPLPDLRTRRDAAGMKPSPEFIETIYDALRKQEWYRGYLLEQDADPVSVVGQFREQSPTLDIANDIRRTLRIDDELRRSAKDTEDYFRLLVRRCEEAGIIVLRNSVVGNNTHRPLDSDEFQGFAQADPIAPLIFVNQSDYLSAQIFTLAHEVAHIWMGVTGVSASAYLERPATDEMAHQRKADEIAAEVLVPAEDFSRRWDEEKVNGPDPSDRLRRHYRVSVFVILRRAYELDKITRSEFRALYDEHWRQIKPKSGGGGGGYGPILSRNSYTFSTAVLQSVSAGELPVVEGAILLNVKPMTLYNLERLVVGGSS
jgi:Zn-dependent peptidase ImmA (M78 family)